MYEPDDEITLCEIDATFADVENIDYTDLFIMPADAELMIEN